MSLQSLQVWPTAEMLLEAITCSRAWQQRQQMSADDAAAVPPMHVSMLRGVWPTDQTLLEASVWSKVWQQEHMQQPHAFLQEAQEQQKHQLPNVQSTYTTDGEVLQPLDALVPGICTQLQREVPAAILHDVDEHNLLQHMCDIATPHCRCDIESANSSHQPSSALLNTQTSVSVMCEPCAPKDIRSYHQPIHVKSPVSAAAPDAHDTCRLDECLHETVFVSESEAACVCAAHSDSVKLELASQTECGTAVMESSYHVEATGCC